MCMEAGPLGRKCFHCYAPISNAEELVRVHTYGNDGVCNSVLRLHRDCLVAFWEFCASD
jgi:hypothetical protein